MFDGRVLLFPKENEVDSLSPKKRGKKNIPIILYFNGSIIRTVEKGMAFVCDESIYFMISQTILFVEFKVELCQGINIGTQKRVQRIKYRCLISFVRGNMKYQVVKVSNDNDIQVMFLMYEQYWPKITGIELYVEFEVAVAEADYEAAPYSYAMSQHHDEAIPSSNPISEQCYSLLIFLFNDPYLLTSS